MRTRTLALILALIPAACARTADKGDLGDPDNNPTDLDDDVGGNDGSTVLDGWLGTVGCVHQDPPTRFNGDLLYIYTLAPEGGAFTDDTPAGRVVGTSGAVDWEAGHLESEATYLAGYPQVSMAETLDFDLDVNGKYTATTTRVFTLKDGRETTQTSDVQVEGCERWETHHDVDAGTLTETHALIVSPEEIHWESTSGPDDGSAVSFQVWAVNTGDWRTEETFVADMPETPASPDREGSCAHEADGTSVCEATTWFGDGGFELSTLSTALEGDSTSVWENWMADGTSPSSFGTTFRAWEGSGWMDWVTIIHGPDGTFEVNCSGEWDELGEGAWTCDDGTEGAFSPMESG